MTASADCYTFKIVSQMFIRRNMFEFEQLIATAEYQMMCKKVQIHKFMYKRKGV